MEELPFIRLLRTLPEEEKREIIRILLGLFTDEELEEIFSKSSVSEP